MDGPRWFGPDRPIWRVHADAACSSAASGRRSPDAPPAGHGRRRRPLRLPRRPVGRLTGPPASSAVTTYGTTAQADQAIAQVPGCTARGAGTADGRPYAANDPHLLTWVHIAEVDSFLRAYQRYGAEPMDPAEQDAYIGDLALVAATLGVPDPPRSVAGLRDRLDAYRPR